MSGDEHACHAEPGWYCEDGEEYGPCAEVMPSDGCLNAKCNRYVGSCPCDCHEEQK